MKIAYQPATGKYVGPRYYLQPESPLEQKWLTVIRDILMASNYRMRMIGCEHSEKAIPNCPAKPVIQAALCIETFKGECPPEFLPSERVDVADPTRPIARSEQATVPIAAVMDGRGNTRVVRQGDTTIVEEKRETR